MVVGPVTNKGLLGHKEPSSFGENEFYQILITQLTHQDPLNPVKTNEFVTQLALLSQVESMRNVEKDIGDLLSYQASLNNLLGISLLGRKIRAEGGIFHYVGGGAVNLSYSLKSDASDVKVAVYGSDGSLVRVMDLGSQKSGDHVVEWDGRDDRGIKAPEGDYSFSVEAIDSSGTVYQVGTFVEGQVSGAIVEDGKIRLILDNGAKISLGDIEEIYQ